MVQTLNDNKRNHLSAELKNIYANLSDAEISRINDSFDGFVDELSLKTQSDRMTVAKIVGETLEFVHSKAI